MKSTNKTFTERVVKMVETCDGIVDRAFYCIRDPFFGHWMSRETFDDRIWTKDVNCRREFSNRAEAEAKLKDFLRWRGDIIGDVAVGNGEAA